MSFDATGLKLALVKASIYLGDRAKAVIALKLSMAEAMCGGLMSKSWESSVELCCRVKSSTDKLSSKPVASGSAFLYLQATNSASPRFLIIKIPKFVLYSCRRMM